jgi:hypothetical protein
MAKIKRSELKSIVKECLMELLSEGLGGNQNLSEARQPERNFGSNSEMIETMAQRKKMLNEKIVYSKASPEPTNSAISSDVISGMTNDPMMAEIFRDTAQTTLMEQGLSNSAKPSYTPADGAARAMNNSDPTDIFSGAENWATLAFSGGKKPG